jgi:preprotein translocase subunit SecA
MNSDEPGEWEWREATNYLENLCCHHGAIEANRATAEEREDRAGFIEVLKEDARAFYEERERMMDEIHVDMREVERVILLGNVDRQWMAHIDDMDQLRDGIGLRAFANRNPIQEYQIEGYAMFDEMVHRIRESTVRQMFRARFVGRQERQEVARPQETNLEQAKNAGGKAAPKRVDKRVGRNDPCPCGSGKKYKNCCGRNL